MRILLLGEYSNVHWTLAEGLRTLGHEVTVLSNGDFWKNYPRDISLVRREGKLGGIIYYIKVLLLFLCGTLKTSEGKRRYVSLRDYDIVQIVNPMFLELKAERIYFFYNWLRRHNKKVVLASYGMDYYWAYVNSHQRPLRYSDFNIGDMRRTDPVVMRDYNDWVGTGKELLNKYIAQDCDAIVAGLYEYDVTYRTAGFGEKLRFVPFPIKTKATSPRNLGISESRNPEIPSCRDSRIRLFLGISKNRSAYKGTDIMLHAAKRIAEKYPEEVELIVAEGLPFAEYKKKLDEADVILDQLYAYTPAMNALEAMNRRTIVVGGGEEEQYDIINERELRPIINVLPTEESVYNELERLVLNSRENPYTKDDRGYLNKLQYNSIEYIRRHHDHVKVARQYEQLYTELLEKI